MRVTWKLTFSLPIFGKLGVLTSLVQEIRLILRSW